MSHTTIAVYAPEELEWAPWKVAGDTLEDVAVLRIDGEESPAVLRGYAQGLVIAATPPSELVEVVGSQMTLAALTHPFSRVWDYASPDAEYQSRMRLESESYGALIAQDVMALVASKVPFMAPPKRTHGPGARDERDEIVLWDTDLLPTLGMRIPGNIASVVGAVYAAQRGNGPVPFRPGFPGVIPPKPASFGPGPGMAGALADLGADGYRALSSHDLSQLAGLPADFEPQFDWDQLQTLLAVPMAAALLRWMAQTLSRQQ